MDAPTFKDLEDHFLKPLASVMKILSNDLLPPRLDAIFFFGRAKGDDGDELFDLATELVTSRQALYLVINGAEGEREGGTVPGQSWAGMSEWVKRFRQRGVSLSTIVTSDPAFNTRQENDAFLDLAMKHGWKTVALLSQKHQAARCMMGQVKACKDRNVMLNAYSLHPETDWSANVFGPQGADQLERWAHAQLETARWIPFWLKGDLCSVSELLQYLNERPKAT